LRNDESAVQAVETISRKWTIEIVTILERGPRRYNQLVRDLDAPVAPKVITRVLRRLAEEKVIVRELVDGSPPGVEYRLTPFGRSLLAMLEDLARLWAKREDSDHVFSDGPEMTTPAQRRH